jgi:Cu2+-exporting ATPase
VIAISISLGAQNGLLVNDRLALERVRTLDIVIVNFDQTRTLTRVSPIVSGTAPAAGVNENDLFAVAMSLSTIIVAVNAQTLC